MSVMDEHVGDLAGNGISGRIEDVPRSGKEDREGNVDSAQVLVNNRL